MILNIATVNNTEQVDMVSNVFLVKKTNVFSLTGAQLWNLNELRIQYIVLLCWNLLDHWTVY